MVAEEIDADYTPVVVAVAVIAAAGEVDYHTGKSADEFADAADVEDNLLFAKHLPETESACKLQQAVDLAAAIEVDVAAEIHCCSQEQEHIAAYYTVDAAVEEVEESEHY